MEWDFLETSECTDFSSKLNHPLPLQLQCPYFPLLLDAMILICQNGEFRKPEGGYHMQWVIIVTMSKSLKLPQLALWIFNLLQWDHCIAFHCNCIQSQNVCGLCLEYSDFSLGCLPLVEYCLSLEYWGSVTPSLQPVWSQSPELRNREPKSTLPLWADCNVMVEVKILARQGWPLG